MIQSPSSARMSPSRVEMIPYAIAEPLLSRMRCMAGQNSVIALYGAYPSRIASMTTGFLRYFSAIAVLLLGLAVRVPCPHLFGRVLVQPAQIERLLHALVPAVGVTLPENVSRDRREKSAGRTRPSHLVASVIDAVAVRAD